MSLPVQHHEPVTAPPVSRRRRWWRWLVALVASATGLLLVWFNVRVHALPKGAATAGAYAADVPLQLENIGRRLREGEGGRMQQIFPEGWFFSHALYGMAWLNVGLTTRQPELSERALDEARWVLKRLDSPEGRAPFLADTQVPNGVFYLGWQNRLLGGVLKLQAPERRNPAELARFQSQCDTLARAFTASPIQALDAYPGKAWPCDNAMAVASLALHDALFPPRHQAVIRRWAAHQDAHVDPATGLIPHRIDSATGAMTIAPRGSTQVYIHAVLPEIDPNLARRHYARYRELFVANWFGYLPVREYPDGRSGWGDVDTGPLIAGIGPSATVVSIAAARANGDFEVAERNVILSETIGLPWTTATEKSFALGRLVVADAFLAWGKSLVPWSPVPPMAHPRLTPTWWRLRLHAVSALVLLLLVLAVRWGLSPATCPGRSTAGCHPDRRSETP